MSEAHPKYLWWNGRQMPWEDATIHVTEIGWSTVGAIFEGIRAYWNPDHGEAYIFRLREHMERFSQSMKLVRLDQDYSTDQLIDAIVQLVRDNEHREDVYIRPLAYRSGDGKSFSGFGSEASILINTRPMPSHLLTGKTQHAGISSWTRISDNVMPPRVKNLSNYRNGQLANMEAAANGYDTAILLNAQGKVAEGPGACLMLVRNGKLITPDVTSSILESITRDALITMARQDLGLEVEERPVDRTELYVADEVFFCGTAAEITPIVSVDRYQVGDGTPGPITRRLEQLYHDVLRGIDPRYAEWRTPVGLAKLAPTGD
ncbi:branched-chain amino acid transaminase [Sphaerobacter thermophilus]|uniref:Branched-chain-amino-acid aminotransferase n=1 Tax=Sphaerobacter thermophilus (strain ATCC 49802 / DSM 20745 / KCCM 41009 / NCIMB 13125 / S 6022) TaxID=479434 RepID=D1C6Y6_SPHTD|nr:branched-chain amino acid transaminase [Sphaerobacter thermophilus]ACZ37747.1 branched-chain amino acid aminotransferase [Sphaerobacter thermophilus DSM 20745]PZN61881.1 MAG: branched-chain amino acid transaminase [Sphaerobacter thermophilus]